MVLEHLEGKTVALIGLGVSQVDFAIGLENSREWDEIWCINSAGLVYPADRIFALDPASRFFDSDDAGKQTKAMIKLMSESDVPIYTCEEDPRIKNPVRYPVEEVCNATKCAYMNNTVAFAIAYALYNKVARIDLFGIDFSYKENMHFAEAGRACLEFWICKCINAGITVGVSPRSSLLDQNVPLEERLYGYHRRSDPKVAMPTPADEWMGCNRSELAKMVKKHKLETVEMPSSPEPYKG